MLIVRVPRRFVSLTSSNPVSGQLQTVRGLIGSVNTSACIRTYRKSGRWTRKQRGTVGKKNGTCSSTISPKRKRRRIFLRSRYAERSIVPREPRLPQFGD